MSFCRCASKGHRGRWGGVEHGAAGGPVRLWLGGGVGVVMEARKIKVDKSCNSLKIWGFFLRSSFRLFFWAERFGTSPQVVAGGPSRALLPSGRGKLCRRGLVVLPVLVYRFFGGILISFCFVAISESSCVSAICCVLLWFRRTVRVHWCEGELW